MVAVRNESLVNELKEALADLDYKPEIIPGEQGVIEVSAFLVFKSWCGFLRTRWSSSSFAYLHKQVARHPDAVTVVTGIVGCAGLKVYTLLLFAIKPY